VAVAPPAPAPAPAAPIAEPVADPGATIMPEALKGQPGGGGAPPATVPPPKERKPERERPPEREKKPKEEGAPRSIVPVLVGAVVVLAIIGFVLGGSGGGGDTGGTAGTATASADVELLAPSGWSKVAPPAIPGLDLQNPVAIASGGKAGGPGVVAGLAPPDAANFTLLPGAFLAAIKGAPEARPAVQLPRSKIQAYRYANLKPEGFAGTVTVFAAQTADGVVEVACFAPAAPSSADCDSVAGSLKILKGSALPVGPDKAFGDQISGILAKADKSASSGRKSLSSAKTNKAQAAAATSVSKAFGTAQSDVGGLKPHPADQGLVTLLGKALADTKAAYAALASAAAKGNKSGYAKARTGVANAEKELDGAMAAFKAAGYDTGT
jgi:hypothetical protein